MHGADNLDRRNSKVSAFLFSLYSVRNHLFPSSRIDPATSSSVIFPSHSPNQSHFRPLRCFDDSSRTFDRARSFAATLGLTDLMHCDPARSFQMVDNRIDGPSPPWPMTAHSIDDGMLRSCFGIHFYSHFCFRCEIRRE